MKHKLHLVQSVILFLFIFVLSACQSGVRFIDLQMSKGIDKNMNPLEITTEFDVDSPVFYLTGEVRNATVDSVLKAEWYWVESDPDTLILDAELTLEDANSTFQFNLTKPTSGWPVGEYEVWLYLDGEYMEKVAFSVTEDTPAVDTNFTQVVSKMETGGYSFTPRDEESMAYYTTNTLVGKYRLSVDLVQYYLGYVNQVERWAEVFQFATAQEATLFYNALVAEGVQDRLHFRQQTVVVITFSQTTIDLLN